MALHKDLTGDDVHETRTTIVNGSPVSLVTPTHAAGVIALDTSMAVARIWRAKSATPGDWELICDINDVAALWMALNALDARVGVLESMT